MFVDSDRKSVFSRYPRKYPRGESNPYQKFRKLPVEDDYQYITLIGVPKWYSISFEWHKSNKYFNI